MHYPHTRSRIEISAIKSEFGDCTTFNFVNKYQIKSDQKVVILTCVSHIASNGMQFILFFLRAHNKFVIFSIDMVVVDIGQVNTQILTSVRCQQMNIVVAYTRHSHQCYTSRQTVYFDRVSVTFSNTDRNV